MTINSTENLHLIFLSSYVVILGALNPRVSFSVIDGKKAYEHAVYWSRIDERFASP